jgi:hypothetical protein
MSTRLLAALVLLATSASVSAALVGFEKTPEATEQSRTIFFRTGARATLVAPADFDAHLPTLLLIFALPNGNTIEQTVGCQLAPGLDLHFDIQHIAAQVRRLRTLEKGRNLVVAYVEADGLSWPAWKQKQGTEGPSRVAAIVDEIRGVILGDANAVALAAHSGGGSFINGYVDAVDAIPGFVERIVFLDANYSFDEERHAAKLSTWLKKSDRRHLSVIAYDDRDVTLNGKKIVSDTGGTWRASIRMIEALGKSDPLKQSKPQTAAPPIVRYDGAGGRIRFLLHENPEKKILHTRLVELNGLLEAMTAGTPNESKWGGVFFVGRAFEQFVQRLPTIPSRRPEAAGGKLLAERWAKFTADQREAATAAEVFRGNFPPFLRGLNPVRLKATIDGKEHECVISVAPDYLAVGSDGDFLRMPLTPAIAMKIATQLGCTLPTTRMVDAIDAAAQVRLEPRPMKIDRESLATFVQHHQIIESQRAGKPLGALICGIMKDVVLTNELKEGPPKVAIYGWRQLDGKPIQPLTTVHKGSYVDYSHGIRLISRIVKVDGKEMLIEDVLKDPKLHVLLSDEGPVTEPAAFYRAAAKQP